jgi:hypothetical protein
VDFINHSFLCLSASLDLKHLFRTTINYASTLSVGDEAINTEIELDMGDNCIKENYTNCSTHHQNANRDTESMARF